MATQWASPAFPFKRTPHVPRTVPFSAPQAVEQLSSQPRLQLQQIPSAFSQPNPQQNRGPNGADPYEADLEEGDDDEDPRLRSRTLPKRGSKSLKAKLLHAMIRRFLVHKKLIDNSTDILPEDVDGHPPAFKLPSLPPCPDPVTVKDYINFRHPGPSIEQPLLLWTQPLTHPWNVRIVRLLSTEFTNYAKEKQLLQLVQLLGDDVMSSNLISTHLEAMNLPKLINDKLASHRSELLTTLRKIDKMKNINSLTNNEIAANLKTTKDTRSIRLRRKERKKLLFLRRFEIIEEAFLKPAIVNDPNHLALWQQIQHLFSVFIADDMTSDETETEKTYLTAKVTRRIRRHWLNPEVFHYIDSHYSPYKVSGSLRRGCAPLVRLLESHKVDVKSTPRIRLPKNVYAEDIAIEARKFLVGQPPILIPKVPEVLKAAAAGVPVHIPMDTN